MAITANVIQNDDNTIELALQGFQIGGQLAQAAGAAAWKTSNEAAAAAGLPLSAYAATPEGGKFMRQRFGGIFGSISIGRDPVTGQPRTLAPFTDRLVNALAAPANMAPEQQKVWAQSEVAKGSVYLGPDGTYKVSDKLSPQAAYYAQQAADMLTRFQPKEQAAQQTPSQGYQGGATLASLTQPAAIAQAPVTTQPNTPTTPMAGNLGKSVTTDGRVLDNATLVAQGTPKPYVDQNDPVAARVFDELSTMADDMVKKNPGLASMPRGYLLQQAASAMGTDPKVFQAALAQASRGATRRSVDASVASGQGTSPASPSVRPGLAMGATDEEKRAFIAQKIAQGKANQTTQVSPQPQISPKYPTTSQSAPQNAPANPQGVNVSASSASPSALVTPQTPNAGNQPQTFRQWLLAHPELSKSMQFTRDPSLPDNQQLIAGAPMAYRKYQTEQSGNISTGETAQASTGFSISGLTKMSPQDYRAAIMQANQATSDIRQLVKGVGKEIDNPMLASMYLPKDAQAYRANEVAMAAAGRQPEVALASEATKQLQARVDIAKMQSENMREVLKNTQALIQPFENELAKVVPLMQTDPKKAKEMLQRIEDSINSDPRTKGYFDTASTAIQALSGDYLKSLPSIFSSNDKRLLATYQASSQANVLVPANQGVVPTPQAAVPGANAAAADAYLKK